VPSLVEKLGVTVSALQLAADRELERVPKSRAAWMFPRSTSPRPSTSADAAEPRRSRCRTNS